MNDPGRGQGADFDADADRDLDVLRAVVEDHDPVPADLLAGAVAAYAARDLDAELAELLFDSAVELTGVRGAAAPRQLSFQVTSGSIEVEIADGRLIGQTVPPAAQPVELRMKDGPVVTSRADDAGHFGFALPGRGVMRLRATVDGRAVVTDWFIV